MKKIICSIFFLILFLWPHFVSAQTPQADYTVSNTAELLSAKQSIRDKIKSGLNKNILVYLRGGTYQLSEPLQFTPEDSGTDQYSITYQAYPGEKPIISGGKVISGWSLFDQVKGIWRAKIDPGINSRQLYINGTRAIRARSPGGLPGAQKTIDNKGYTYTPSSTFNLANWKNKTDIEFVSDVDWKQFRCRIESVNGSSIIMMQPCFANAHLQPAWAMKIPDWIENAYELLDSDREWYLDRTESYIYYKPSSNENMTNANVVLPALEQLIVGVGTDDLEKEGPYVQNIKFVGLEFAYAGWVRPSFVNDGYVPIQADMIIIGAAPSLPFDRSPNLLKMPANISFKRARNIVFDHSFFDHLGGAGLSFDVDTQDNTVINSEFTDISGSAIQIGHITWPHVGANQLWKVTRGNKIVNNKIYDVAKEYWSSVGIWLAYVQNSLIKNNTVYDLPYTGISLGWGWGGNDWTETTLRNNRVANNLVYNHMRELYDGGGIYTLSAQRGTVMEGNVIRDTITKQDVPGQNTQVRMGIYFDDYSRYIEVRNNVIINNRLNMLYKGGDHYFHDNYWQDRGDGPVNPDDSLKGRRYWEDIWEWDKQGLPDNTLENNTNTSSLTQAPTDIISHAGVQNSIDNLDGPQDMVFNGSFEQKSANWWANAQGYEIVDTISHSGKRSLKIKSGSNNSPGFAQHYFFWPNTMYTWSAFVKTVNNTNRRTVAVFAPAGTVALSGFAVPNADRVFVGGDVLPTGSSDWQKISLSFKTTQAGPGYVYAVVDQTSNGEVYFDDVSVVSGNDVVQPVGNCPKKSQGDFNCDGNISLLDFNEWRNQFKGKLPTNGVVADTNGDGKATLVEFNVWRTEFKKK